MIAVLYFILGGAGGGSGGIGRVVAVVVVKVLKRFLENSQKVLKK